jgi:hypothetical protein
MKWTVRTKEGELVYESFGEVEKAWLLGLVEPDDELLEEGKTKWRRAGSIPLLVQARRTGEQAWGGAWFLWILTGIMLASSALWLARGGLYGAAVALGIFTMAVMAYGTWRAAKRARPHGDVTSSRPPSPAPPPPPS